VPNRNARKVGEHAPLAFDQIQATGTYCATRKGLGAFRIIHVEVRAAGDAIDRKPYVLDDRPLPPTEELRRSWVFYGPTDEAYAKGFCSKFDAVADQIFVV
jgi:hypothetical protein